MASDWEITVNGAGALVHSSAQRTKVRAEEYAQQISHRVQDRTLSIVRSKKAQKGQKLLVFVYRSARRGADISSLGAALRQATRDPDDPFLLSRATPEWLGLE